MINIKKALLIAHEDLKYIMRDISFNFNKEKNICLIKLRTKKMKEEKEEWLKYITINEIIYFIIMENSLFWENIKILYDNEKSEIKNNDTFDLKSIY